jgi:hypothetical protein
MNVHDDINRNTSNIHFHNMYEMRKHLQYIMPHDQYKTSCQ